MTTLWFIILAGMLTVYAVLDGFDLGVGALLPWVCKTEDERLQARDSIGPVWNGNEVWLLAAGGAMVVAFPRLYAASFSGFYLALMLVLWMLILRGVGFEFRHAHPSPMWTGLWDMVFSVSSAVLTLLFGVAVGNVLRGVPLDSHGEFTGSFVLILNPFAIIGGLLSVAVLCMHGAAYLNLKTTGALQARARALIQPFLIAAFVLTGVLVAASFLVRPAFAANYTLVPVLLIVPLAALSLFVLTFLSARPGKERTLFAATSGLIASLLASVACGMFPRLLPALSGGSGLDLTITNASAGAHGLVTALFANVIGLTAVSFYTVYVYKLWGKSIPSQPSP